MGFYGPVVNSKIVFWISRVDYSVYSFNEYIRGKTYLKFNISQLRLTIIPNFDYHYRRNPYHDTVAIEAVTSRGITILSPSPNIADL